MARRVVNLPTKGYSSGFEKYQPHKSTSRQKGTQHRELQAATAATTLLPGAVRGDRSDVFDPADL